MKHEIVVPSAGESVTEAFIGKWHKQDRDTVKKGDVLVELESQKATMELESEYSGKLEILVPTPGAKLAIGQVIATIDDSVQGTATTTPTSKFTSPPVASPSVRKLAAEKNIDLNLIKKSGEGDRIVKEDIDRYLEKSTQKETSSQEQPKITNIPTEPTIYYQGDVSRGVRREVASRIRQQIAKNLIKAQHTAAILTTFNEVDMSQVMDYRKQNKEKFQKKYGIAPGLVAFFAMACVRALKTYPLVNAIYTGEEIVYHDYIDMSVAVSTERGLVVPIIKNTHQMNVVSFEQALNDVSIRARDGKLSIPEMTGGTFTISNGGIFGSLLSTPLLNMPQAAILGLHKIENRAVVIENQIVIRPMMYLALSYDHRLIDGREAVQFLVNVKEGIENINLILENNILK